MSKRISFEEGLEGIKVPRQSASIRTIKRWVERKF